MSPTPPELPADSDVDLHQPAQRAELARTPWTVLAAIAAGGAIGSSARYGLGLAFPTPADDFPWTTFMINTSGTLLIGVLMVLVTEVWTRQRLIRPVLGVGVLGGYTTFSTYIVDIQRMLQHGAAATATAYLVATVATALAAAATGIVVTSALVRRLSWTST